MQRNQQERHHLVPDPQVGVSDSAFFHGQCLHPDPQQYPRLR
jgi:hypothetical protein